MQMASLGKTALQVSRLGIGLFEISTLHGPAGTAKAGLLLNAALDGGINFLDTASCYGDSEDKIGSSVAHRRDEYVLATKCGHPTTGASGVPWTAETVEHNIESSLRRMRTDYLDIVQLHSCDVDVLESGEVIDALSNAKESGKTRFIGYSGDNEAARWAVESGIFDTLQTSLSMVDQHARTRLLGPAEDRGMGIIVKRPVGNGAWDPARTSAPPAEYIERARELSRMGPVPGAPDDPILLSLGFVYAHEEVDTAIVGTTSLSHLRSNIDMVERRLPIATESVDELRRRFDELGETWRQMM
jgi:aryl-alcohol dehydrogenase-like predicted oxidoreductase